jgi:hypothetical protein
LEADIKITFAESQAYMCIVIDETAFTGEIDAGTAEGKVACLKHSIQFLLEPYVGVNSIFLPPSFIRSEN